MVMVCACPTSCQYSFVRAEGAFDYLLVTCLAIFGPQVSTASGDVVDRHGPEQMSQVGPRASTCPLPLQ